MHRDLTESERIIRNCFNEILGKAPDPEEIEAAQKRVDRARTEYDRAKTTLDKLLARTERKDEPNAH
jgi:hypothetical protein